MDEVKTGKTVFVKTDFIGFFFRACHPNIRNKYVLITHNSAFAIPGSGQRFLEDDRIIEWFGQNPSIPHKKLFPIPVVFPNRFFPIKGGNLSALSSLSRKTHVNKSILLYVNFKTSTHVSEWLKALEATKDFPFIKTEFDVPCETYVPALSEEFFKSS